MSLSSKTHIILMEQEYLKELKEKLNEIHKTAGKMDMEISFMFDRLRLYVAGQIKI